VAQENTRVVSLNPWGATDAEMVLVARAETVLGTGVPPDVSAFHQWWLYGMKDSDRVYWLAPGQVYSGDQSMYYILYMYQPSGPGGTSWERLSLVRCLDRHNDADKRVLVISGQPELSRAVTELLQRTALAMRVA